MRTKRAIDQAPPYLSILGDNLITQFVAFTFDVTLSYKDEAVKSNWGWSQTYT
ncbi:MAG: hypothetical protein IKQ72_06690 [Bacteroidaceae bacterium]|nr:hypothetical protein [Bacteroidaceae bacterium]